MIESTFSQPPYRCTEQDKTVDPSRSRGQPLLLVPDIDLKQVSHSGQTRSRTHQSYIPRRGLCRNHTHPTTPPQTHPFLPSLHPRKAPLAAYDMPLASVEDWRARIGSCWCVLSRPFNTGKSTDQQRPLSQPPLPGRAMLHALNVFVAVILVLGIKTISKFISECRRQLKSERGEFK